MGLFDKLKSKAENNQEEIQKREEDYLSLYRVYLQAAMASNFGITNLNALPELKAFKVALRVPTVNGKLGLGEKSKAKSLLMSNYGLNDDFFKEFDKSIAKNCKNQQQIQSFFLLFQNFLNDFITLLSNHLGMKLRIPNYFSGILRTTIEEGVKDVLTKTDWDKPDAIKMSMSIRQNNEKLGYSVSFLNQLMYPFFMIAKGVDPSKLAQK